MLTHSRWPDLTHATLLGIRQTAFRKWLTAYQLINRGASAEAQAAETALRAAYHRANGTLLRYLHTRYARAI